MIDPSLSALCSGWFPDHTCKLSQGPYSHSTMLSTCEYLGKETNHQIPHRLGSSTPQMATTRRCSSTNLKTFRHSTPDDIEPAPNLAGEDPAVPESVSPETQAMINDTVIGTQQPVEGTKCFGTLSANMCMCMCVFPRL